MSTPLDIKRLELQNIFPVGELLGALAATESELFPKAVNTFRKQSPIFQPDYTNPGNQFQGRTLTNPISTRVDVRNNIRQY
jgi:hypothetical protein